MKKNISKDEYEIRTLNFYQNEGGIYNELITALTKLRMNERGLPQTAKVLNEACYWLDKKKQEGNITSKTINTIRSTYLLLTVAVLAKDQKLLSPIDIDNILKKVEKTSAYDLFNRLFSTDDEHSHDENKSKANYSDNDAILKDYLQRIEQQTMQIQALEDELNVKDSQLKDAQEKLANINSIMGSMRSINESEIDKALTLSSILDYAKQQKQYQLCNQILEMLTEFCINTQSWDKITQVRDVKQVMIETSVQAVHNHNNIQASNVFTGEVNNAQFPINPQNNSGNGQR